MVSIAIDRNDGLSSSTAIKGPCRVATTANITLSGTQTIDGVAVVAGDRVLVRSQTTASQNGIYIVDSGPWRRARDFAGNTDVRSGTLIYINSGATGRVTYAVSATDPITIGTTSISFYRFEPGVQEYTFSQFGTIGTNDDSAVWNAAILEVSNAGGGIIRASGLNTMGASVRLRSNVYVVGYGKSTRIKLADGASASLYNDGSQRLFVYADSAVYCGLADIYVDGNDANNSSIFVGVGFQGCSNVSLRKVVITDVYGSGAAVLSTSDFEFEGLTIADITGNYPGNNPGEGLYLRDAARGIVSNVRGLDIDDHLVYLDGGAGNGTADVLISDAIGYNCGRVSKSSAFNTFQNVNRIKWENCHSYGSGTGFTCIAKSDGTLFPQDIEWNNCTAFDSDAPSGEANGWSISGTTGRINGRYRLNNCKSKGNGLGTAGVVANGLYVTGVDDVEINNFNASNNNDNGVYLTNVTNFTVNGRAINNSRRTAGAFDGFRIGDGTAGGDCSAGYIDVVSKDTAASGKKQDCGVRVRGTSSDITVTGKLDGNLTASFLKDTGVPASVYFDKAADIANQIPQSFTLRISNAAGTLKHVFGRSGTSSETNSWMAAVSGATASGTSSTPTGADASTAFVAGGKISSATTSRFILDTSDQTVGLQLFSAVIVQQNAAAGLMVRASIVSINVNGTTRNRLCFDFYNLDGTTFALTTANIADTKFIDIVFNGYLFPA